MKKITPTNILVTFLSVTALGSLNLANAHDSSGSLGYASSSIDYYQVHCYDNNNGPSDHLVISVKDSAPVAPPKVSIQVILGSKATNSTDAVDGDATYSPVVKFKGGGTGNDYYYVTIDKTAAGSEDYAVQYHCETSGGQHTGTDIFQLTNQ